LFIRKAGGVVIKNLERVVGLGVVGLGIIASSKKPLIALEALRPLEIIAKPKGK
jgi:hypothetical protein